MTGSVRVCASVSCEVTIIGGSSRKKYCSPKCRMAAWLATPEGRELRAESRARHNASDKGRARTARYLASDRGKATVLRYRLSDEGRAAKARWRESMRAAAVEQTPGPRGGG